LLSRSFFGIWSYFLNGYFASAYSGDHDRLRSEEKLRSAKCILSVAHFCKPGGFVTWYWLFMVFNFKWMLASEARQAVGKTLVGK